jgi:uncharacterized membrane protein (UPF0127 family)
MRHVLPNYGRSNLRFVLAILALSLSFVATACNTEGSADRGAESDYAGGVAFDTTTVWIEASADTITIDAEVAERPEQHRHGLMERRQLAENAGMLFLYPEPQDSGSGFWMFRTRVPLDVAFLDDAGLILAILTMQPCPSPNPQLCPSYTPGLSYSAALEVNAGFFVRHNIGLGDRVLIVRNSAAGHPNR